jgi:hypothetical protein
MRRRKLRPSGRRDDQNENGLPVQAARSKSLFSAAALATSYQLR